MSRPPKFTGVYFEQLYADKLKFQIIGAISVALSELISAGTDFR